MSRDYNIIWIQVTCIYTCMYIHVHLYMYNIMVTCTCRLIIQCIAYMYMCFVFIMHVYIIIMFVLQIELVSQDRKWLGPLKIGLTSCNPSLLPSLPSLSTQLPTNTWIMSGTTIIIPQRVYFQGELWSQLL